MYNGGMKKLIIVLIVLAVFAAAWFIFRKPSEQSPAFSESPSPITSASSTPSKETTGKRFEISIKKDGVSNNNLSIKAGDTVTFVNEDAVLHWPAAGTHPTHNLCPGFDPLHGLIQGKSFSFTFNQAGVCPFHDHLNARNENFSGTITIEGGK